MKDWNNANSLFQRRLPCCRRPRVLRSLISAREQKKQPRISFVESRIAVSMFFVYQIFCWLLITKTLTPGSGRVWDSGKRKISWRDTGFDHYSTRQPEFAKVLARDAVLGEKNGVRYLSDISSRFRIVVKKEQECAIRNPLPDPARERQRLNHKQSLLFMFMPELPCDIK